MCVCVCVCVSERERERERAISPVKDVSLWNKMLKICAIKLFNRSC